MNREGAEAAKRPEAAERITSGPNLDYRQPDVPPPVPRAARVAGGILLILLVLPASFGFLASFEAFPNAHGWRIGYATFGLACLVSGIVLIAKK